MRKLINWAIIILLAIILFKGCFKTESETVVAPPPPPPPVVTCQPIRMFELHHKIQTGQLAQWENNPANQASVLVAQRMGGKLWTRYESVTELKAQYSDIYTTGIDYTTTSAEACNPEIQQVYFQQMEQIQHQILDIYRDIIAADGNR